MAVILETTIGDIVVDLYTEDRPRCCLNFLKLCKLKYYNFSLFNFLERNFIAQSGIPLQDDSKTCKSVFSHIYGDHASLFVSESVPRIRHTKMGSLSMVNNGAGMHSSQFFITLAENLDHLDQGGHTVFGEVVEGMDILEKFNEVICNKDNRPFKDIRVSHTILIDDPYDDPEGLHIPSRSPSPDERLLRSDMIGVNEELAPELSGEEFEEVSKEKDAKATAQILEMLGDLPDAEVKPDENVLFVCKLNPVTTSDDLQIIFSRFGEILSCEVIKDHRTNNSLQYAFIEFKKVEECERAYFKMDNVLIDDRRIHVDFSQSVAKVKWSSFLRQKSQPSRSKAADRPSSGRANNRSTQNVRPPGGAHGVSSSDSQDTNHGSISSHQAVTRRPSRRQQGGGLVSRCDYNMTKRVCSPPTDSSNSSSEDGFIPYGSRNAIANADSKRKHPAGSSGIRKLIPKLRRQDKKNESNEVREVDSLKRKYSAKRDCGEIGSSKHEKSVYTSNSREGRHRGHKSSRQGNERERRREEHDGSCGSPYSRRGYKDRVTPDSSSDDCRSRKAILETKLKHSAGSSGIRKSIPKPRKRDESESDEERRMDSSKRNYSAKHHRKRVSSSKRERIESESDEERRMNSPKETYSAKHHRKGVSSSKRERIESESDEERRMNSPKDTYSAKHHRKGVSSSKRERIKSESDKERRMNSPKDTYSAKHHRKGVSSSKRERIESESDKERRMNSPKETYSAKHHRKGVSSSKRERIESESDKERRMNSPKETYSAKHHRKGVSSSKRERIESESDEERRMNSPKETYSAKHHRKGVSSTRRERVENTSNRQGEVARKNGPRGNDSSRHGNPIRRTGKHGDTASPDSPDTRRKRNRSRHH